LRLVVCSLVVVSMFITSSGTFHQAEGYPIDVGAMRLEPYVDPQTSLGQAALFVDNMFSLDFVDVSLTVDYYDIGQNSNYVSRLYTFAEPIPADTFMFDPVDGLIFPLDQDWNPTIQSISFTGALSSSEFSYNGAFVRATGGIRLNWEFLSQDGVYSLYDFGSLTVDVQESGTEPVTVPEPPSLMLIAAGGLGLLAWYRKFRWA
jgi:hypothetical protein